MGSSSVVGKWQFGSAWAVIKSRLGLKGKTEVMIDLEPST